jgi:hypothetical protein
VLTEAVVAGRHPDVEKISTTQEEWMSQVPGRWIQRKIHINENHIANAISRDEHMCMVAEAIQQTLPHVRHVQVDLATIRWSDVKKGLRYVFLTPRIARQAIIDFDQGRRDRLVPFDINLKAPAQVHPMRIGEHKKGKRASAPRARRKRTPSTIKRSGKNETIIGGAPIKTNGVDQRQRRFGICDFAP